ncbi:hypothetical protein ABPG74_009764 [Tetrahymena malaccensis]
MSTETKSGSSTPGKTQKGKIWTKLSKGSNQHPDKSQLIIADYFSKQGKIMKSKRYFELYPTQIFYYSEKDHNQPKGYTDLSFELCFELLREKVAENKDKKDDKVKLGKPKGIKLDKGGCVCELYSPEEKVLIKWRDALRKILNQRGFHELFRAHKKIGKGNFASVYLAERLEDEKMFAVKAFSKEAAYAQEKGKEALLNEIDLMRALDHPNIMKLHEVFETENSLYFILDLLEGGQLYDKMKSKHRYTSEEIKDILRGLLEGCAHMHQKRIMHRDLKPENVLFKDPQGKQIVIADLGLATRCDLPEYLFVRCGTPGFVAPEVVNIKNLNTTYDPICDLFSIGLMFHILLIGKSPFDGKTYNDILSQNRACNIKFDSVEYLKLPLQTYDLLKKMLEKDPKNRINAADALKHPFFDSNNQVKPIQQSNSQTLNDSTKDEIKEDDVASRNSSLMNSPINSPNIGPRKINQGPLNQDSCLTFKMANTPVLNGRVTDSLHDSQNNDSFQCLDSLKKQIGHPGQSQFGSPDLRNKSTSFGVQLVGQKSPDMSKNNLKRALLNNMKDFNGKIDTVDEAKDEIVSPIKQKGVSDLRNKLKDNI